MLTTQQDPANRIAIGIHVPSSIAHGVLADEKATRHKRQTAVQQRDLTLLNKARLELKKLYPKCPIQDQKEIIAHAFKKGSGRVGRATQIDLRTIIKLAVEAYVRHKYSNYDVIIEKIGREAARKVVREDVRRVIKRWTGREGIVLPA